MSSRSGSLPGSGGGAPADPGPGTGVGSATGLDGASARGAATGLGTAELGAATEFELVNAARDGSSAAFGELYGRHVGAANKTARYFLRGGNDCDDVVSDAFAGVLTALRNGSGPTNGMFRAYLMACVRNGCKLRGRQGGKTVPVDPADFADHADAFEDPERFVEGDAITTAYSSLSAPWQRVLWLTEVEDRPLGEVAESLHLRKPAAAALAYRAHEALTEAYLAQSIAKGHGAGTECERVAPHLARYVRKRCRAGQRRQIDAHVSQCLRCATLTEELRRVNNRLRALVIPPVGIGAFLMDHAKAHGAAARATVEAARQSFAAAAGQAARTWPAWLDTAKAVVLVAVAAAVVVPAVDDTASVDGGALTAGLVAEAGTRNDPANTAGDPGGAAPGGAAPGGSVAAGGVDTTVADAGDEPPPGGLPTLAPIPAPTTTVPGIPGVRVPVPVITVPAIGGLIPTVTLPTLPSLPADPLDAVPAVVTTIAAAIPSGSIPAVAVPPVVVTASIDLGSAQNFAVLANAAITSTGLTTITGHIGSSIGTITGLLPFQLLSVLGFDSAPASINAQAAVAVAVEAMLARPSSPLGGVEIGGRTITPGTYNSGTIGLTGTVVLDAGGDPDALFVFTTESTLITASSSRVVLTGGADPCNVFWAVGSSATFGTFSDFSGTVIAHVSVTATTESVFHGRLLAQLGAVTLDSNIVDGPVCA